MIENIRHSMKQDGVICIHEPLLLDQWNSDREGYQALWMACYAMTLLKLTLGAGTCYSIEEHHAILAKSGMRPSGSPQAPVDGCTALFYEGPALDGSGFFKVQRTLGSPSREGRQFESN